LLLLCLGLLARFALAAQIIHQHLRVHFFLNVKRRGLHHEIGFVLHLLAAPDELRIQIAVPSFHRHAHRRLLGLGQHGLIFRRGDVLARGVFVLEGFDADGGFGFFGGHLSFASNLQFAAPKFQVRRP